MNAPTVFTEHPTARELPLARTPDSAPVTLQQAARARLRLVLAPPIILMLIAGFVGFARHASYAAEAELSVAGTGLTTPGVLAEGGSGQVLAAAFSNAVGAPEVTQPVARQLGVRPNQVAPRLTGSPILKTNLFRIDATGGSAGRAIKLANLAGASVIAYIDGLNRARSARLASELSQAYVDLITLSRRSSTANTEVTSANLQVARTRVEALQSAYRADQTEPGGTNLVQIVRPATSATSDRRSVLGLLLFSALAAGLIMGLALAFAVAKRAARGAG